MTKCNHCYSRLWQGNNPSANCSKQKCPSRQSALDTKTPSEWDKLTNKSSKVNYPSVAYFFVFKIITLAHSQSYDNTKKNNYDRLGRISSDRVVYFGLVLLELD